MRQDLGISNKLLEIALNAGEKQTLAWETGRKNISRLAQQLVKAILADHKLIAKLLLQNTRVWAECLSTLQASVHRPFFESCLRQWSGASEIAGEGEDNQEESVWVFYHSQVPSHLDDHMRIISLWVDRIDEAKVVWLYRKTRKAKMPEIEFAHLFARELEKTYGKSYERA